MIFFWYELFCLVYIGYLLFYWLLFFVFVLLCGKVFYEWIYYFSISVLEMLEDLFEFMVDVLIIFVVGEFYEMIEEILIVIKNICYLYEIYFCDEVDDLCFKVFCVKLGIYYVIWEKKINVKVGNINNVL